MNEPEARFSGRIGGGGGRRWVAGALIAVVATVGLAVVGRDVPPAGPSAAPSRTTPPSPAAPTVSPACDPIPPDSAVPLLRVGSATHQVGVRGLVGTTHRPGNEEPGRGWQVPGAELTLELRPREVARLVLGSGDCLRFLQVEAAPADLGHAPSRVERTAIETSAFDPPATSVGIDVASSLDRAAGDWVLRITAEYWTGPEVGPDHDMWAEQYFRIRILERVPTPRPMVTPAVPCKFFVAEGGVGARLRIADAEPVFGPAQAAQAAEVEIAPGVQATIALDGDGCAIEWQIEYLDAAAADVQAVVESVGNLEGDPDSVSQNRWTIEFAPPGISLLRIRYRSTTDGPWLEAWWRIRGVGGD